MAGAAKRAGNIAKERMLELEYKLTHLQICSKAYHAAAEIKMNRNRTAIRAGKIENRQLRAALDALLEAERCSFGVSDMNRMVERVKALRRVYDQEKDLVWKKQEQLQMQMTDARSAELDLKGIEEDRGPIAALQARIDLTAAKITASRALLKSYTATATPMRAERAAFELQMATLERTLKRKECHLTHIILLSYDSERARNAAKIELDELLLGYCFSEKRVPDTGEERAEMDVEMAKIVKTFEEATMREVFLELLEQEKRSQYYAQMYKELMDIQMNPNLTAEQRRMMRRNLAGFHVLDEVMGIEGGRRGPFHAATLASTVAHTQETIHRIDRDVALKRARHSGNLISMLTGTKRLVDKILLNEFGGIDENSPERILQRCKKALVRLLKEVYNKVKAAKADKDQRELVEKAREERRAKEPQEYDPHRTEIEAEVQSWLNIVERRHTEMIQLGQLGGLGQQQQEQEQQRGTATSDHVAGQP